MVFSIDVPTELEVQGDVAEGYGPVADAFRRNVRDRGEVGAACAVVRDGEVVVDLWGGYRDGHRRLPWAEDTLVTMFSTTKGVASMAVALAHARGLVDYDAPVARYWPEFAAAGKDAVTVRQLLSHQAGLAVIDSPLDVDDLLDLDRMAAVIAAQAPAWQPGTRHGYHGITLGWYEGELIRRVDPDGRSLGRFFAEEIARPLDLDVHIGLPDDVDVGRLAFIHGYKPAEMVLHVHELPWRFVAAFLNPRSATARSFANPAVLAELASYNRIDILRAEIPAANGTGRVRDVARAYGEFATGDQCLGLDEATLSALRDPATPPAEGLEDEILKVETTFSLGYIKPFPRFRFGTAADAAFGTPGAGGSFGFADPDVGIGFCYAPNRSGFHLWDDPRELALRDALYVDCLAERPQHPDR
ncbi:serine hydrolase domain-containing protein [Euzebya sp.]|uniref:serine hydrolase domain-containing protein n=1 Tax=Euzebya sp. TaxID=1971409 RepID=UPI00351782EA